MSKHKDLSDFFKQKLREGLYLKNLKKEDRERQDMVIFSILLLISRLVPAFHLADNNNLMGNEDSKGQQVDKTVNTEDAGLLSRQSREQSIYEFVDLIKDYSKSGTYFVRKISA